MGSYGNNVQLFGSYGGTPNGQWVAQLDGVTQFWQLTTPITINSNSLVKLSFIGGTPANQYSKFLLASNGYIGTTDDTSVFDTGGVNSAKTKVNGQVILKGSTQIPADGLNILEFGVFGSGILESIGATASGANKISLPLFNFEVWQGDVLTNLIPLTNKAQGATQLATVGNVNAFMPNYTEAVWRKP